MVSRRNREYITVQLIQTRKMLEILEDDPIMTFSLKQKEKTLIEQLDKIPVDKKDSKVVLLFNGNPPKPRPLPIVQHLKLSSILV